MSDCTHVNVSRTGWEWNWAYRNRYAGSNYVHDDVERRRVVVCLRCGEQWAEIQNLNVKLIPMDES